MGNSKLFVNVNGKIQEFSPINVTDIPTVQTGNVSVGCSELGREMSVSFKPDEGMQRFIEQMKKELSVVDITDWPAQMIQRLLVTFPDISKLVTRNPKHYHALEMEEGFCCVAGDYDTLFKVPLILDKKGKIKAAYIKFEKKGGGADDDGN